MQCRNASTQNPTKWFAPSPRPRAAVPLRFPVAPPAWPPVPVRGVSVPFRGVGPSLPTMCRTSTGEGREGPTPRNGPEPPRTPEGGSREAARPGGRRHRETEGHRGGSTPAGRGALARASERRITPAPYRILFESRPQFQVVHGATKRPVTRRHRCVGSDVVRE